MSTPKIPQDHLKKKYPLKLQEAISLQAANLLQRAQLHNMATKIIMALAVVRPTEGEPNKARPIMAGKVQAILSMDRNETAEARTAFVYPDARIQAVIDKAVDEISAILLEDV